MANGVTPPEQVPRRSLPRSRVRQKRLTIFSNSQSSRSWPVSMSVPCLHPHAAIVTITAEGRSTPTTATTSMSIYRPDLKCEEDSHGIEPVTGRSPTFERDYRNADNCSDASGRWFASQGPGREADNCIEQVEQSPH